MAGQYKNLSTHQSAAGGGSKPVRCPICGRIKAVQSLGDGLYRCGHCLGPLFEANPTYDGPASNDPVRAAEMNERQAKRKAVRR